jgi:hypothetical protein
MINFIQEIRGKNPKEKRSLTLKSIYILLFCLVFGIGEVKSQSTNLVNWNFNTSVTNANYATSTSNQNGARTSALTNVTLSSISIVGGATGVNASTFHRTTSWPASSDNGRYLQFSIDLTSGETFANQAISVAIGAQVSSTTTAARNYTVTYGYGSSPTFANATNGAVTGTGTSTTNTTNISIPAPGNTTTTSLTVRILVFGSSGGGNFRLATIALTGYSPLSSSPSINASVSTLPSFVSSGISNPSDEQSFTVSGSNLTSDITLTPPIGYQVSTTSGSGFGSSVTLTHSGGTVNTITIYVRFNPSVLAEQIGGNIACTSTGASTQNIAVSGEVTNLSPGAIAFIAFQGVTTDYFRIVALEDIPANTRIWFTDKAWDGNGGTLAFTSGEGNSVWTSPNSTVTRGTVIEFAVSAGTVNLGTGAFSSGLGNAGEQLFAYQGSLTLPTFVAGYTSGTTISTGVPTASGTDTWVPASLTNGTNFVALGGITFGSSYVTVSTNNRSLSDMRSHIHNLSNLTTGNTSTTTYTSWPAYTFNFIADEPTSQPSFTPASNVGNNQMDLNFSGGNGTSYIVVMREGSAVDAIPTDATNYSTVSGSVNFSSATELSAGQRIVYNGTTSTGAVTVTNLSPGTTYHFAIYAYNGTTTTANFNLTSPGTGNQLTTGSANSNASDIIASASFTEPSNIAYASNQENTDLTFANSIEVAQFTLRDGGATTDGDGNSTTINSITFTIANHVALRRLALYDGSTELAEVAISSGTATYSGLTLAANDNSTNDFSLRASFAGTITDNTQFSFTISSATADIAGSTFAAANAGGAATSTTDNRNKIEVTATLLAFVQNTSNVSVLTAMSPAPTVSANDALGNRDLDYVTDMEVTTSGTFAGAATLTETPAFGLATFDNLQFQDAETGINIAVSSGALTPSGNSNDFDITSLIMPGDIAFVRYQADAPDAFSIITFVEIPANQTFYFTDNAWTTASGPLASNEQAITWTTPASVIPAGTVITFTDAGTTSVTPSGNGGATGVLSGLATGGDQILMYRGTNITTPTAFICGVSTTSWVTTGSTTSNTSYLPSDLTLNVSGVTFSSHQDNGYYNGTQTGSTSTIKALVNNGANWVRSTSLQSAPTWSFNLNSTTTTISASTTVQNLSLDASETFVIGANTLTINGAVSGAGTITGGTSSNLTIGGSAGTIQFTSGSNNNYLRNLTLNASSSLTIGNALNITGGATPGVVTVASGATLTTGNNLVLKSDASGTASIGNSAGTISGNVTVERFIPRRRAFRFLASPVTTSNFISGSWQQATHITGSLTGLNGFDQSNSGTASLFTYNASSEAWTAIPNTNSTNLNIGTGYRMLIRGDRNINLNTTTPQDSAALVLSATGSVVTGDVIFGAGSVSSSPAGIPALNAAIGSGNNNSTIGWSLIGNPYASAVNWASVTKSNVSTTFATWNVNNAGRGNYVYHSGSVGTGNGASNIINSGQSIFVQTTESNPSITFTEASKVTSTPPSHFKKSLSDVLNIDIFIGDRAYDALTVMFDANTSNNYDVQDFIKLVNPEINFYSYLADGTKLAMNSMKEITSETIVPLGLNGVFNGGSYELKFSNQNTFNNSEVYLKDKFINKTYDLKSINNLTFNVTADSNSFGENRFELIFSKSATGLNNELISSNNFIVFPNPANNVLNLSLTTTKEDNYNFTIYNQLGAEVNAGNLDFNSKRTHALNIENLSNGVYFIQVKNGKTAQTIKFIK